MKISQRIQLPVFLISLALLMGQYAAFSHATKHPFHESVQSCQVFFALEKSELGLISDCGPALDAALYSLLWVGLFTLLLPRLQGTCCIRAPPLLP